MVTMRRQACLQLLPRAVYISWCFTFAAFGIYALFADNSLKAQPCGQMTHIWKYSLLNVLFCCITMATFFMFPGGGEGARARALVVTIFYAGFATWGALMWFDLNATCSSVLGQQYNVIFLFHHMCVFHNAGLFVLMLCHETYAGAHLLKADYTLMPEISNKPQHVSFASSPGIPQEGKYLTGQHGPMMQPGSMIQPGMNSAVGGAGEMAPDIINDYKDIIKSPSHLPKSEP